jgi:type IV fimbrial biogenesis protein FimT
MRLTAYLSNSKGFSLFEIMIATAIIGLLAEVVAHNIITQLPKYRLNGASRKVAWDLMDARMKAIKKNTNIKVSFPNNHEYTIWADTNNDNVVDVGEPVETSANIQAKYHDVSFAAPLPAIFAFSSKGMSSSAETVALTNSSGSKSVAVSISGNVKVH